MLNYDLQWWPSWISDWLKIIYILRLSDHLAIQADEAFRSPGNTGWGGFQITWVYPQLLVRLVCSIFSFICMFCRSLFVLLYFFFWPLCCLFFFDIRNPVISREWGKDREVFTTSGTYPWSLSKILLDMGLVYHPSHKGNDVEKKPGEIC
jgi:hypothetical protein